MQAPALGEISPYWAVSIFSATIAFTPRCEGPVAESVSGSFVEYRENRSGSTWDNELRSSEPSRRWFCSDLADSPKSYFPFVFCWAAWARAELTVESSSYITYVLSSFAARNERQGLKSCSQAGQYPGVINDTPSSYADFQHGSELFTRQSVWAPAIGGLRFTPTLSPLSCREKGKFPTAPQDLKI